jgi:hypothetical protein
VPAAIALMMKAAGTSETSVNFYQTTQRNIPEDSHLLHHFLVSCTSCKEHKKMSLIITLEILNLSDKQNIPIVATLCFRCIIVKYSFTGSQEHFESHKYDAITNEVNESLEICFITKRFRILPSQMKLMRT